MIDAHLDLILLLATIFAGLAGATGGLNLGDILGGL